jgi:hypothetical protein
VAGIPSCDGITGKVRITSGGILAVLTGMHVRFRAGLAFVAPAGATAISHGWPVQERQLRRQ